MKLEVWTQHGPLNSEPIFNAFIKSLHKEGDTVVLNKESDADVAVIWSVLWLGRMRNYQKIWERRIKFWPNAWRYIWGFI